MVQLYVYITIVSNNSDTVGCNKDNTMLGEDGITMDIVLFAKQDLIRVIFVLNISLK